jgi:hypothetical protein
VENSIQDVKEMIISRLGDNWKREWVEEVQGLLERDAGWGWRGFWECVERNIDVRTTFFCTVFVLFFVLFNPTFNPPLH